MKIMRYGATSSPSPKSAFDNAAAIFLDWDGCVMIGNTLIPAARTLLERHADRVVILSNNSTHLPEDFTRILKQANVHIPPDRIILAGAEAVRLAMQARQARIMLLGSTRIKAYARHMGLTLVRDEPDHILLMRDARFTYAKLCRAANALQRGAKLIVANVDTTHPGLDGHIVPETGAMLAALLACVRDVSMVTVGKPGPLLFARACEVAGVAAHQAVMIGDNPETDGKGATDYGIYPLLIGPDAGLTLDDIVKW
ncbi:HAD-IIA family hydrolase [Sphingobium indicum]|nr:HAD family hydrolase [Sphingobium indicum]